MASTNEKKKEYNDLVYRLPANGMTREQAVAQDWKDAYNNWAAEERNPEPPQYELLSSAGNKQKTTYPTATAVQMPTVQQKSTYPTATAVQMPTVQQKSNLTGRQALDSIQMPGDYQSQYQRQLQGIMGQLQNRQPFTYDVNGDALYQQYKDQYMRGGKLAMQDTMGQAAALTGGYGNSYAASAGNQAYQAYLGRLNEAVPQLYSLAMDKYNNETNDLRNMYNMYNTAEQTAYGRWSDDWSRWINAYQQGVSEDQWNKNFNEGVRQYDQNFAEGVRQYNQNFAEDQRQFNATYGLNSYKALYGSGSGAGNGYSGLYGTGPNQETTESGATDNTRAFVAQLDRRHYPSSKYDSYSAYLKNRIAEKQAKGEFTTEEAAYLMNTVYAQEKALEDKYKANKTDKTKKTPAATGTKNAGAPKSTK